jgi:predicted MFS family arabinose efflux permease
VHTLAYFFGGMFAPVTAIVTLWGLIHTGGFLICQTRISAEAPEAPELATSLMVSFGNAGFALGSFLGGIVITRFGIQNVVWMSILCLLAALALSFVFIKKRAAGTATLAKETAMAA